MRTTPSRLALGVAIFAGGLAVGASLRANADQPHMHRALDHLRAALGELEAATHDKGGHRGKAASLVKDAIDQVHRGIEAAG